MKTFICLFFHNYIGLYDCIISDFLVFRMAVPGLGESYLESRESYLEKDSAIYGMDKSLQKIQNAGRFIVAKETELTKLSYERKRLLGDCVKFHEYDKSYQKVSFIVFLFWRAFKSIKFSKSSGCTHTRFYKQLHFWRKLLVA